MPFTKAKKETIVKSAVDKLSQSSMLLFTHFSKISVEKMRELRKNLKSAGADFKVVKKSLLGKALEKAKVDATGIDLKKAQGTVGVVFGTEDQLAPTRTVYMFSRAKENESFKLLGGIFDGKLVAKDKLALLAKVSSRNDLIGGLLRQFNAPLSKLVYVVKAIADSKNKS